MDLRIPLSDLDYGEEEEQAVLDVLRSRWLTMGVVTQRFEQEFASMIGVKHALAVANCTVALHMACLALGIGVGDEVIAPSLTFVASTNAILYTGARVRFADISGSEDLTISPESIESEITPKCKAIMVMHYGGYPCRMPEILAMANKYNLAVIEDSAHAPGASLEERCMGTWGDIGCFSFFSNKNLATGEGGMITTNRDDLAERIRTIRSHGMTTLTWDRHHGHAFSYDVIALGYNYRIDEIHSALGLAQLKKLVRNNARRKELSERYWQKLAEKAYPGVGMPFIHSQGKPAYHIFPLLLPEQENRQLFMTRMRNVGIQTSIHYPPIHRFSYYCEQFPGISLPVTEKIAAREVTLPLYPGMQDEDVDEVVEAVGTGLGYL